MNQELRKKVVARWQKEVQEASLEEAQTYYQLIESVSSPSPEARKEYYQVLQYRDLVVYVERELETNLLYSSPKRAFA